MKHLFLIFAFSLFLNADYLNTKTTNQCVYDVKPYQNHKGWCYTKRSNNQSYCSSTLKIKDLIAGYEYKDGDCVLKNDLGLTGLSQEDFDYLMALIAHFLGLTTIFLVNFIAVLTVRR